MQLKYSQKVVFEAGPNKKLNALIFKKKSDGA